MSTEYNVVTLNGTVTVHGEDASVFDGALEILKGGKIVALFKHWEHVVSTPLVATYRDANGGAA